MFGMKKALGMLMALAITLALASSALAAQGWFTCSINMLGTVNATSRMVYLTDTGNPAQFKNQVFRLTMPDIANEQIAQLLTAMASGKNIYAYINGTALSVFYIVNQQ